MPIGSRILRESEELKSIRKLNPQNSPEVRKLFLANYEHDDSLLNEKDKPDIEDILVKFNDIFARHRFDIGVNSDFKIKLTPKTDQPAYTQSLPCHISLNDDLTE